MKSPKTRLLAAVAVCLLPLSSLSDTETVDGITWRYSIANNEARIFGNSYSAAIDSSVSGDISIPDRLGGSPVVCIGNYAFSYCSKLTSVAIPATVRTIEQYAFQHCTSLTELILPEGVESIATHAFDTCSGATSISIPNSVTTIGSYAFAHCSSLTSLVIPDGLTSIADYAFYECSALQSVVIPGHLVDFPNAMTIFSGCSSIKEISIPGNPNFSPRSVFNNSWGGSITNIVVAPGCTSIPNSLFSGSGATTISLPDTVTYIGTNAFTNCKNLSSLVLPEGLVEIAYNAFYSCSLSSIVLPESLERLDDYAFNLSGFKSLVIPRNVSSLGANLFANCFGLEHLYLPKAFEGKTSKLRIEDARNCEVVFYDVILDVTSKYGISQPENGINYLRSDLTYDCFVQTPIPDESVEGLRYECTGWTGTGSVPSTGSETNCTLSISEDSSLTWTWETQALVSVSATGGECDLQERWVGVGRTESAVIKADCLLFDVSLSGDTNGVVLQDMLLSIPVDGPRSINVSIVAAEGNNGVEAGVPLNWRGVGTNGGWHVADDQTADDGKSLKSGIVDESRVASVEAVVPQAGTISFDWRISGERGDYARFYLDGAMLDSITRSTQWRAVSRPVGDGVHVLRWTFEKGTGAMVGDGAAFLDNVRWAPLSLGEALDATSLAWTTSGDEAWIPQVSVSNDGEDAAKSGSVSGQQTSLLSTTVRGPGTLAWKWKADVAGVAGVEVYLDGEDLYDSGVFLDGESDWTDVSLAINGDGEHSVVFEYWNGGTETTISDRAFIDCVSWTPDKPAFVVVEGVSVPVSWFDENAGSIVAAQGGDYEEAGRAIASNGVDKVWQCYVSGVSPTNAAERFLAEIRIVDGEPVVTPNPDLGAARDYVVEGKASLTNEWSAPNGDSRFFRVKVQMPE